MYGGLHRSVKALDAMGLGEICVSTLVTVSAYVNTWRTRLTLSTHTVLICACEQCRLATGPTSVYIKYVLELT